MAALPAAIEGRREAPAAADRLPTLTEVVEIGQQAPPTNGLTEPAVLAEPASAPAGVVLESASTDIASAQKHDMLGLSSSVLAELQPRIEMLFEARLREALAPALARAADGLIRDTREQLSATLQALVQEAVSKVLERQQPG